MSKAQHIVNLIRKIYSHFNTPPVVIELINYRFYVVSNIAQTIAWATHLWWLLMFYSLGVHEMAFIQIPSIFVYAMAISVNRRGFHMQKLSRTKYWLSIMLGGMQISNISYLLLPFFLS